MPIEESQNPKCGVLVFGSESMSEAEPEARGTWRQVAAVIDGKNVPVGPGAVLTVAVDGYTVTVNGKVIQRGVSKSVSRETPRKSDVVVTEGLRVGETLSQISTIEGDVLIACNAPPGADRPTAFTSPPGSGHTLSVWLRTKETIVPAAPLTGRTWLLLGVCILLAGLVGGVSEDLAARLGPWAGIAAGSLAGALFFSALFRAMKWNWQNALTVGITMSIIGNVFDSLKTAVGPTLSPFVATLVSASTAGVLGFCIWTVLSRLFKLR